MRQLSEIAFTRRTVLAGACVGVASGCVSPGSLDKAATDAETIGRLAALEWAARPEITPYVIPEAVAPHYAEACTALGAARLAAVLDDPALAALVRERWERAAPMENTGNHVDANVIGVWGLVSGTETGRQYGLAMANKQWADADETGLTRQARFWIDDIYMIASLQAQAWRDSSEPRFLERAALMATRYLARLQQPNGLFHHALDSPFFWARGNGWVAAGLAELLSVLPRSHSDYMAINAGFVRMAEALVRTQRADGLWGQLIDRPEFWSESSGSAMFAYAFLRGANLGFLPGAPFRQAALQAFAGLKPRVEPDGKLRGVCVGTGRGDSLQYYFDRPTVTGDLHGQAPLLWLSSELLA
jgi:unsaturated rhamnogalacturonyl hydrolase